MENLFERQGKHFPFFIPYIRIYIKYLTRERVYENLNINIYSKKNDFYVIGEIQV